jgi:hypothetical protein
MFVLKRKMPKHDPQPIPEPLPELFEHGISAPAVGTLKIAVGHYRDRRIIGTGDVVVGSDGSQGLGHLVHVHSL